MYDLEEMQKRFYEERKGKQYGMYVVTDVEYDWERRKQKWTMKCVNCGREIITYNGADYVKGRNTGLCTCEKERRREDRHQKKIEMKALHESQKIAEKEKRLSYVGKTIGKSLILSFSKPYFRVRCLRCGLEKNKTPKEVESGRLSCQCENCTEDPKNLIGITTKYATVIGYEKGRDKGVKLRCLCGNIFYQKIAIFLNKPKKTCGDKDCVFFKYNTSQMGESAARIYRTWSHMLQRCYNPNIKSYRTYGKRGITVCDEWKDFSTFKEWAETHGYQNDLTIDRKDPDKGYCPENCRWVTLEVNARENKHPAYTFCERPPKKPKSRYGCSTRMVEINGETKNIIEWCEIYDITLPAIEYRVRKYGISYPEAITMPKHEGSGGGRPPKKK